MSTQLLQVQFLGVDEGGDPKALAAGSLLRADNVAMDKYKRLVKRDGTTRLPLDILGGGEMSNGVRLITRGSDLAVYDGTSVYSYSSALSKWRLIDRPPALMVERQWLADSSRSISSVDAAIYASVTGLRVTIFTNETAQAFYTVEEVTTGAVLVSPTAIGASSVKYVRVLINSTTAYLMYSIADKVCVHTLNLTTLALSAVTDLVADALTARTRFDAVIGNDASSVATLYLVYQKQGGNARAASFTLSTFAQVQNYDMAGTGTILSCAVAYGPVITYLVSSSTLNLCKMVTYDRSLVATVGALTTVFAAYATFVSVVDRGNASDVIVTVQHNTGGASAEILKTSLWNYTTMAEVAASVRTTYGLYSPSKAFIFNARFYCTAVTWLHPYTSTTDPIPQASVVVVEIETANSVAGAVNSTHRHAATLENQTGWYGGIDSYVTKATTDTDGNTYIPAARRNVEPPNSVVRIAIGWGLYKLSSYAGAPIASDLGGSVECMGSAFCWSGAPFWYDGDSSSPYGIAHAPIIVQNPASAGGAVVAGNYYHRFVDTWRDANGVTHRSIPSAAKLGTTVGANLTLTPIVSSTSLSSKQRTIFGTSEPNAILKEAYRTTINSSGPHYRLTYEPTYQVAVNDPQNQGVSLVDARADADITGTAQAITLASRKQLYTDTGEIDDVPPPAFRTGTLHRGRIVGVGPDLRTVWLSKDSTQDPEIAPGFNEALTLVFASDKYALASIDEKLVAFGASDIDLVYGDGPDATGQNNNWQIQRVQSDVGCTNPRSVATSQSGIVFQSARGIEILDRGLNVTWIGRAVEDTLATYPVITSAVLVAKEEEIRFTCTDDAGEVGIVLVYDYVAKLWFTRTYLGAFGAGQPFVDAKLVGGVYTMLTNNGEVYQETSATKLDYGSLFVGIDVILAPVSPAGNLAWSRIKDVTIMGTSVTNHDLKVSVARDYATSYEQDTTFLAGSTATTIGPLEKCRLSMQNQKCQAIQVRIQDLTPTSPGTYPVSTGDGPILEGLAFRVSVRPGAAKTAAGQRG